MFQLEGEPSILNSKMQLILKISAKQVAIANFAISAIVLNQFP